MTDLAASGMSRLARVIDQVADALIISTVVTAVVLVVTSVVGDGAPKAWRETQTQGLIALAWALLAVALAGASLVFGLASRLHNVSRLLLATAATLMVLVTVAIVGLRYGAGIGTINLQEGVIYLHGGMFLLGIAYALRHDAHVRVDLIYARLNQKQKAFINLLGHYFLLIPVALEIIELSGGYVQSSWRVVEGSAEVGGVPAVFVLKTLIPAAALVLLVQGVAESARCVSTLLSSGSTPLSEDR